MTSSSTLTSTESSRELQRIETLRWNRTLATALLGVMVLLFVGTSIIGGHNFATLLLRAAAEAGIVGGLADWFAVTALFRHPLGLPIPHTAILPNNRDRIGVAVGPLRPVRVISSEAYTSSGINCPSSAKARAPASSRSHSIFTPVASTARTVASATSGPIPSPGMSVT